jgi:hypothetical protein
VEFWLIGELREADKCEGWVFRTWKEWAAERGRDSGVGGYVLFKPLRSLMEQRSGWDVVEEMGRVDGTV